MATINKDKYHPWNTVREQLNTLRKGHRSMLNTTRKQRNELLQEVVILESSLRNIKILWRHFCKLSVWKEENSKPRISEPQDALHYILKYVVGTDRNAQRTSSFYKIALQALLVAGVPREQIAKEIEKRNGLRAIVDQFREENDGCKSKANNKLKRKDAEEKITKSQIPSKIIDFGKVIKSINISEFGIYIEMTEVEMYDFMANHDVSEIEMKISSAGSDESGFKRFELLDHEPI